MSNRIPIFLQDQLGGKYQFDQLGDRTVLRNQIFDNMIEGIGEGMRKARAQKKITDYFNAPFIEDVAEPVVGYKRLHCNFNRSMLFSAYNSAVWLNGELIARCPLTMSNLFDPLEGPRHPRDQVPHPDCTCGIYAYSDIHPNLNSPHASSSIVVQLNMGGYVLPYSQGYRAQIAKITKIYLPPDNPVKKGRARNVQESLERLTLAAHEIGYKLDIPVKSFPKPPAQYQGVRFTDFSF